MSERTYFRNKDAGLVKTNGGRFHHTQQAEPAPTDLAVLEDEHDDLEGIEAGAEHDPAIIELLNEMYPVARRAVSRIWNTRNLGVKKLMVSEDDAVQKAMTDLYKTLQKNGIGAVENPRAYVGSAARRAAAAVTALSTNSSNHKARNLFNEMEALHKEVWGHGFDAELRDEVTRKIRESWETESDRVSAANGVEVDPSKNKNSRPTINFLDMPELAPRSLDFELSEDSGSTLGDSLGADDLARSNSAAATVMAGTMPELEALRRSGHKQNHLYDFAGDEAEERFELLAHDITHGDRLQKGLLARQQLWNAFAARYDIPDISNVVLKSGKCTKIRDTVATPDAIAAACRTWNLGETNELTEAFFAPFGDIDAGERDQVVHLFSKVVTGPVALDFWQMVVGSVNAAQHKRDAKNTVRVAARAN